MPAKKKPPKIPQSPLINLSDALHTVGCTVDLVTTALASSDDPFQSNAAMVLQAHVYDPIEKARAVIEPPARARSASAIAGETVRRRRSRGISDDPR